MQEQILTYEHPLDEHTRTCLRLEHLFAQQQLLFAQGDPGLDRAALLNLLDLLECLDRGDIKAEFIKALENHTSHFQKLLGNPNIDESKLTRFLEQLERISDWLRGYQGKFGMEIRNDAFLEAAKHRIRIPGGACCFDLPELHYFLNQPAEVRQQRFGSWMQDLSGLSTCIRVLLRLLREKGKFAEQVADGGFFQQDFANSHDLIRIAVPGDLPFYPEVSASRRHISVRFLEGGGTGHATQTPADVPFDLALC